jgi:hypothetical protein
MPNDDLSHVSPQADAPQASASLAVHYKASIYPDTPLDPLFAASILELQAALQMKLWMLVQGGRDDHCDVSDLIYNKFRDAKAEIMPNERVGLVIHSPGGDAAAAYKIARLFQRRTTDFFTIVPLMAKSAATLVSLGGKSIIMGSEAELGPLDVQLYDDDREEYDSALNAVQSLERLNSYAISAVDQAMLLLVPRTGKKPEVLIPHALAYATSIIRPLVEKIDTIDLTRRSRELKVAEDYAVRLMRKTYGIREAQRIASSLVERYSTHPFVIDREEAGKGPTGGGLNVGLNVEVPSPDVETIFSKLASCLDSTVAIGCVEEIL